MPVGVRKQFVAFWCAVGQHNVAHKDKYMRSDVKFMFQSDDGAFKIFTQHNTWAVHSSTVSSKDNTIQERKYLGKNYGDATNAIKALTTHSLVSNELKSGIVAGTAALPTQSRPQCHSPARSLPFTSE